ncbi:uncharacterized protein L969DRAFT_16056 [Mixia osmundae IAM 14324]|uniref:uncharacterized protein n=1 Tax=Mixia osmundae (strain CBS 9802 / IAM 14324 / JCM 22182 / KY 12970) TaxID=764103 RepID=UPI0004A548B5|nr:uncharacterized protein L969DRAFT_16056 [Mixia osmundae IAM 14324]KEI40692.1 hypothetical protein L969DRAFT_16056 [Mixia osmundae IAM 14324]
MLLPLFLALTVLAGAFAEGPQPAVTAAYCLLLDSTTVTSNGIVELDGQLYAFQVKSWSPMQLFTLRAQVTENMKTYCFADRELPKGPRCEEQERKVFHDHTIMQVNAVRRLDTVHIDSESEIINRVIGFCCSAFWSFTAKVRIPGHEINIGEAVYTFTCGGGMRRIPEVGTSCSAIFEDVVETKSAIEDKPGARRAIYTLGLPKGPACDEENIETEGDQQILKVNAVRRLQTVHVLSDSEIANEVIRFCCSAFWSFTSRAWMPNDKLELGKAVYTFGCGGEDLIPIPGSDITCPELFAGFIETRSVIEEDKDGAAQPISGHGRDRGCTETPVPLGHGV